MESVVTKWLGPAGGWPMMPPIYETETRSRDNVQAGILTVSFYFLYSDAFTCGALPWGTAPPRVS